MRWKVGLSSLVCTNETKTEYMIFNQDGEEIKSLGDYKLTFVDDFVYLGSWINSCKKDADVRINKAWAGLRNLEPIWKSTLPMKLKLEIISVNTDNRVMLWLMQWTLTKELEKKLDGFYTKILRVVKNVSWKQHMRNEVFYGKIPKVMTTTAAERVRFSGHCWRSKHELAHQLLL